SLFGRNPFHDLEGNFGSRFSMQADERWLGNAHQRIINLEVKEGPKALLAHLIQATRLAAPAAGGESRDGSTMPIGGECNSVLRGQQDLAGDSIDDRNLALDEKADLVQSETIVLLEKGDCRLMILRAGHDVKRDASPVAPAEGYDLLSMNLK